MLVIIFLIQISIIHCNLNVTETTNRIKDILTNYKSNRCRRCTPSLNLESFVKRTASVLDKTGRFGDFLTYFNVSQCSVDSDYDSSYVSEHILSGLLLHDDVPDSHWHEYKSVHNKKYRTRSHEKTAQEKWRKNLRQVARHNKHYLAGKHTYSLHLNHFGDLDATDYFKKILKLIDTKPMFDPAQDHRKTTYRNNLHRKVPKQVDWRSNGYRPRREEQWRCGACYAFAVTHAMQAQLYKEHGDWNELSPQQIVDCSYKDGNMGCDGGSLRAALRYASREGLIMETHYPYIGKKGVCHYNRRLVRARPRRWATLPGGDERALEAALATVGPLAVAVNAAPFTFQLYRNGIYDDPFCTPWKLNHAMLLVGYTPQYWILLNWWGPNWGEDGYMRIRRGFNRCGVATMATYVEL